MAAAYEKKQTAALLGTRPVTLRELTPCLPPDERAARLQSLAARLHEIAASAPKEDRDAHTGDLRAAVGRPCGQHFD